jgi:hypothetical protein
MEAERGREDPGKGSQVGCNVQQLLDVYADLRISRNGAEIGIRADGDEIGIESNLRDLIRLARSLRHGRLSVRFLDQMLIHGGLTLVYQGNFISLSLLGFKANRWVKSLVLFLFS